MRARSVLVVSFFSLLLVCPVIAGAAEKTQNKPEYVIKWGTIAPENTVWGYIVTQASKEIEEKSGGRLKNIWYFGGVMGDEPDLIRKSKIDQLQGLALLTVGISKLIPELTAFSLPFLFDNYEQVDCVFKRVWPSVEKISREKGYVPLGRADVGFSVFFSKDDLGDPEQVRETKVWKWSGLDLPLEQVASWALGMGNFVTLSLPDVLTALQTGLVDTVYATYYSAVALQWQTQFKYMTDVDVYGGAYAPALVLARKEVFDSLPPDIQKIMREVIEKHAIRLREGLRKDENQAKEELVKRGIKFTSIDPALYRQGRQCMEKTIYDYYRFSQADLGFLRKNVLQCWEKLYVITKDILAKSHPETKYDLPLPSMEGTEKLINVFVELEQRFFTREFVYEIITAHDQCVMKK